MSLLSRMANAFRSGRLDRELDDELHFHLQARVEELMRQGMSRQEAETRARARLGNSLALRETSRDIRLAPRLEALWRDARFGLRMLAKDRIVTAAAVLSLALAIGACTASFALIDALILRPLPVRSPEQLVYLTYENGAPAPTFTFSYPMLERLRAVSAGRIELIAAGTQYPAEVTFERSEPEKVYNQFVSGNFFAALSITPAIGRVLTPEDDVTPGGSPVAVLGYNYWMRRFGGSPAVLGRRLQLTGKQFQVIGVARKGFTGVEPGILTDIWTPQKMGPAQALTEWRWQWFRILGRLKPGVTAAQVRNVLQAAFANARREWAPEAFGPNDAPDRIRRFLAARLDVQPGAAGPSNLRRSFARPMWVLAMVAALVLLIACSNLANLFAARAMAREREMALRVSIGAGRGRLVQQMLVEGAMLAVAACALGLAFGAATAPVVVRMLSTSQIPVFLDLHVGWHMVAFAALAGIAATFLFALIPALRASSVAPQEALKGGAKLSSRRAVVRPVLAAQIALSFTVLFVGGMFLISFHKLLNQDLGFSPNGVVLVTLSATDRRIQDAQISMTELLDRVRALPGVKAAGISEWGLFSNSAWTDTVIIPGRAPDSTETTVLPVSPGFFGALGIRLLAGRDISLRDVRMQSSAVVLPNRSFASADRPGYPQEIVGVVRNARYESVRDPAPPTYYIPLNQMWVSSMAVRAAADPLQVVPLVRDTVRGFGHSLKATEITLQSTLVEDALIRERLLAVLSGFFALVAIALAGVGLYGVLSYSVVRRTREIGIRVALGARRGSVVRLVLSEIALVTCAGLGAGFLCGKLLSGPVAKLLYEVKPTDTASIALPLACLLAAAAISAVRPALKAAKVDPAVALREE